VGELAERNNKLLATTVSFADSITGARCSPNVFRVNARAGMQAVALADWVATTKPGANVFYLGPDYEMGRSTVGAFKSAVEGKGAKSVGEVFAPLDNKDYSPYFGQMRSARPAVIYTSVAGNDTVRFFNQMAEFGVNRNVQVVGASGTVTGQNLAAIGKNADGFVTGVGYSPLIDTPENKRFVAAFEAANKAQPDLYGADSYSVLFLYKAAVEKARSTDTEKVREAMRGMTWATPQGNKTIRAGDHQAMQDMYAVKVNNGKFEIVGRVPAAAAIGPDACAKF
jgi:branched-chain amino acid transport system substrate-binding protein